MFLTKIDDFLSKTVKTYNERCGFYTLDYLKKGKYNLYYFYELNPKCIIYVAICKDLDDCYQNLAEPYLAFTVDEYSAIKFEGKDISFPLIQYIYELEQSLDEEKLKSLYSEVTSMEELVKGLTPEEAEMKMEKRKEFLDFLKKLDRIKDDDAVTESKSDKVRACLHFEYEDTTEIRFSITLIAKQKNSEVKDLRKFLTGFKERSEYPISTKMKITLEPMSFFAPYDRILPSISNNTHFARMAKVSTHTISYEVFSNILDVMQDEAFYFNNVKTKIQEKDAVSFTLNEEGYPLFQPPYENKANELITLIGKECVYTLDFKKNEVSSYPFTDSRMKQTYLYFLEDEEDSFSYIQDIFNKDLLPKLSTSLRKKKAAKEEKKPFEIALFLSIDEEKGLLFKTTYLENGNETKEISSLVGQSMKSAYLSLITSMGGKENGNIKNDEEIVHFLSQDMTPLSNISSLYLDERLKPANLKEATGFHISMTKKGDYLSMTLDSKDYSKEELLEILSAYKQKKKYFLLKNGFVFLRGEEIKEASQLFGENRLTNDKVPLYKLFSLDNTKLILDEDDSCKKILSAIKDYRDRKVKLPDEMEKILRPYQKDGIRYLMSLHDYGFGGILADEMGLGKTLQTIGYIQALKEEKPVLIITPKAVLYNWEKEIRKFSTLPCKVIDNNKEEREKIISNIEKNKKVLYCISYDTFKRDEALFQDIRFATIVLDEAQSIKNSFSKRHQALLGLKATNRLALTGTPLENSPFDLWSIFDFLMPGYLGDEKDFQSFLDGKDSAKKLATLLRPFLLRRRKDDVLKDLPSKSEDNVLINMSESERMLYLAYLDKARALSGENKISILASLTRLRQLCVDPSSFLENFPTSTKLEYTVDLVRENLENGHKAIIFSSFKSALLDLKDLLDEENINAGLITGDTSAKDRLALCEDFNTKDDIKVMLVSLKAGGVGLNLIGADTVIHLDPWWNPQAENQATDRAHRIGQTRPVTVLRLIMRDTVEEKVLNLQKQKKDLYDEIVEGNGGVSSLSDDDIKFLLS